MNASQKIDYAALELRFNGPIPKQHLMTSDAYKRRQHGSLSVLEGQVQTFLDCAERAQLDAEDYADQPEKYAGAIARMDHQIRCAAEAMYHAIPLREALGLPSHPIVAMMSVIYGRLDEAAGKSLAVEFHANRTEVVPGAGNYIRKVEQAASKKD